MGYTSRKIWPKINRCENLGAVCRRFETSRRRDVLSFSHHAEVAYLPPNQSRHVPSVLKIKRIAVGAPSANCEKKCDGAKKRRTERLCWGRVARETMTFTIPKAPPVGGGDDQCRRLPSRPAGRRRRRACASLFSGRGGEGDQGRAGDGAQRPRPRWPGLGLAKRSRASTSRRFNRWWFWPSRDRHGEGRRLSCCPGGCVTALWAENLAAVLRVVVFKAEYSGVLRRTIGAPCCVVWRWSLRA